MYKRALAEGLTTLWGKVTGSLKSI